MARAAAEPVARLATISARSGAIDLVPVTFALVGTTFVTAVDHKPKTTRALARLDNVRASGTATVLVDHFAEDWSTLWWVRLRGPAHVIDDVAQPAAAGFIDALVAKYAQYQAHRPEGPLLVVEAIMVRGWEADGTTFRA
jgi:PPOX class probable F420-dependent enzyme